MTAITTATPWETTLPSSGSNSCAIAASPRKPMPRDASVIPNWHELRYFEMSSRILSVRAAPGLPSRASCSMRGLRVRTRENSAATKNPFNSTSTSTPRRRRACVKRAPLRGLWRRGCRYFEAGRRHTWSGRAKGSSSSGPHGDDARPDDLLRGARAVGGGPLRQAEIRCAVDEPGGAALAHGGDREARVDAERGRDDRGVDAVQALVAVD